MPWYRGPNGLPMHLHFGSAANRSAPHGCQAKRPRGDWCGMFPACRCDWKTGGGKTCSVWLCADHAQEVAPDKHLCPAHQQAYRRWQAGKEAARH